MTIAGILGRITYTTVYIFLCVVLAVLLLLVPADIVRQVLSHNVQKSNILVLVIAYVITLTIVLFVYALRLYTTRTLLASIPKPHFPTEKGSVNKEVRAMILTNLSRSAAIAYEAQPRVLKPRTNNQLHTIEEGADSSHEDETAGGNPQMLRDQGAGRIRRFWNKLGRGKKKVVPATVENQSGIATQSVCPVWGHIEHDGWESPESDLPDLQYSVVLAELPNLIEAKAVSLAPPDPAPSVPGSPALDPEAVALLQRAPNMTMRDYIGSLTGFGILPSGADGSEDKAPLLIPAFMDTYERARFSTRPMPKALFRELMHLFAELLRVMRPPDQALLYADDDGFQDGYEGSGYGDDMSFTESDGHIDDDAPRDGTPTTPTRSISGASLLSRRSRVDDSGDSGPSSGTPHYSRRRPPGHRSLRHGGRDGPTSVDAQRRYRTAPTTPMSRFRDGHGSGRNGTMTSESSESLDTFARTRQPYPYSSTTTSFSSSASLRSLPQRSLSQRSRRSGPPPSTSSSNRSLSLTRTQSQQGSIIIRLAGPEDGHVAGGLPYVLRVGDD